MAEREREGPLGGGQLWPVTSYTEEGAGQLEHGVQQVGEQEKGPESRWASMGLVAKMTRVGGGGRPKACNPGGLRWAPPRGAGEDGASWSTLTGAPRNTAAGTLCRSEHVLVFT